MISLNNIKGFVLDKRTVCVGSKTLYYLQEFQALEFVKRG
jgi:hypothetical protein